MKTWIKKTGVILSMITLGTSAFAQVGIGVATPHIQSILDLTNTNDKGLLLPKLSTAPGASSGPEAMLFYYGGHVYYRNASEFNGLSPWRYKINGSVSNNVTFLQGNVGIGISDSTVKAMLHVADSTRQVTASGTSGAFLIGNSDGGTHMLFDNDEIMVKSDQNTGGTMKLQEEDGSLTIGTATNTADKLVSHLNTEIGTAINKKNLTVYGNVDANKGRIKEYGNDLLPKGSIIMWNGSTVPAGWALCDGSLKTALDGTKFTAPDLRGRFIVGQKTTDASYNVIGKTGGANTTTILNANLPQHQHTGTTDLDGEHEHTEQATALADNDDNDDTGHYIGKPVGGDPASAQTPQKITNSGSAHKHKFTTDAPDPTDSTKGCSGCKSTPINNLPPYYTLAYIIKL